MFTLSGGAISLTSKRWDVVAFSTTEAEYMVATRSCKEVICLNGLYSDIEIKQGVWIIYCDYQSAICLDKNVTFHVGTKHIDV